MDNLLSEWAVQEALQKQFPMHYSAQRGNVAVMKSLIGRGCVVNCSNLEQVTPLHEAATAGHTLAVKFLLDEGAWFDAPTINGVTPLAAACAAGHAECVQLLLERNVSVNPSKVLALVTNKSSPLHEAVINGNVQCVKLLIKSKAELNLIDLSLGTPLQAACRAIKINLECITLLIQAGADVNTAILDISPLHIAASRNLLPLVQLLLNYGADVYLRDNLGRRPKELVSTTSNIWKVLNNYELNPRSLADSCRLSILRFLVVGRNFENIRNIGLPHKVVHFILNKF